MNYGDRIVKKPHRVIPSCRLEDDTYILITGSSDCYVSQRGDVVKKGNDGFNQIPIIEDEYPLVDIDINGETIRKRIDELVAKEFLIAIPGKTKIFHRNGNKSDCVCYNLMLVNDEEYDFLTDQLERKKYSSIKVALCSRQKYSQFIDFNHMKVAEKWKSINQRVKKANQYQDVTVCKQWANKKTGLDAFTKWAWDNIYEYPSALELDKDVLSVNSKKTYSPKTCLFLPRKINLFMRLSDETRNIKTKKRGGETKYIIPRNGKYKHIVCDSLEEAEARILFRKSGMLRNMIDEEIKLGFVPIKVLNALQAWVEHWIIQAREKEKIAEQKKQREDEEVDEAV